MTTQFKLAAALILSGMIVAGCQKPADKTEAPAAAPAVQPAATRRHLSLHASARCRPWR